MDAQLFEEMLYQEEGSSLDFKRDQYSFVGKTGEQKSELLKDILAFANSWRQGDAYILIGVDEVKGGRSIPVGISAHDHIEDASLQQFVNQKTNRPIAFSYEAFQLEGKQFGVIRIEKQQRPFFLKKKYGRLFDRVVYVRRESSTAEASPEDIHKMGEVDATAKVSTPVLDLQFVDTKNRKIVGKEARSQSSIFKSMPIYKLNNFEALVAAEGQAIFKKVTVENPNFWTEMNYHIMMINLLNPFAFHIKNLSAYTALDVRIEIAIRHEAGLLIADEYGLPQRPSEKSLISVSPREAKSPDSNLDVTVLDDDECSKIEISFGKVQPKASKSTKNLLYIGSRASKFIECDAVIYADNLPSPQMVGLHLNISAVEAGEITNELIQLY